MNTLIIVKMQKITFQDWKKKFDEDSEIQSKMMKKTIVGKVDDKTAMISTEVINKDLVEEFMNSEDFKKMETNLGLHHDVYGLIKT